MKVIKLTGSYGAHWGLTDLYPEYEEQLRAAIESGEDFVFSYGCKKEIHQAEIKRANGELTVWCEAAIDELGSLTDTVMWEAMGENAYAGSGYEAIAKYHDLDPSKDRERICEILDECQSWFEGIYQEYFESSVSGEGTRSFEEVMDLVAGCEEEADNAAKQCYEDLIECAKESIAAIAEQANMHRYV